MTDVRDDPAEHRYDAVVDGEVAGFLTYTDRDGRRTLVHTVVEPAYEGRGIGSDLVRTALADARAGGYAVVPVCPFVRSYLERHPDDVDLVPAERRAEFGLGAA